MYFFQFGGTAPPAAVLFLAQVTQLGPWTPLNSRPQGTKRCQRPCWPFCSTCPTLDSTFAHSERLRGLRHTPAFTLAMLVHPLWALFHLSTPTRQWLLPADPNCLLLPRWPLTDFPRGHLVNQVRFSLVFWSPRTLTRMPRQSRPLSAAPSRPLCSTQAQQAAKASSAVL
jgi:hypothetical protein